MFSSKEIKCKAKLTKNIFASIVKKLGVPSNLD
jgi:hypothetical protein